jgi:hypothetical protein
LLLALAVQVLRLLEQPVLTALILLSAVSLAPVVVAVAVQ